MELALHPNTRAKNYFKANRGLDRAKPNHCNFICKTLGINTSFYKENSEEATNGRQLVLVTEKDMIHISQVEEKIKSLEQKVIDLEIKIEIINQIFETVKRIDQKV